MKRYRFLLLWFLCVVLFYFVGNVQREKRLRAFHEKVLDGRVSYLHSSAIGTRVALDDSTEKHLVFTKYNEELQSFFYRFVQLGDSIYKAAYADSLFVYKPNHQVFAFQTQEKP